MAKEKPGKNVFPYAEARAENPSPFGRKKSKKEQKAKKRKEEEHKRQTREDAWDDFFRKNLSEFLAHCQFRHVATTGTNMDEKHIQEALDAYLHEYFIDLTEAHVKEASNIAAILYDQMAETRFSSKAPPYARILHDTWFRALEAIGSVPAGRKTPVVENPARLFKDIMASPKFENVISQAQYERDLDDVKALSDGVWKAAAYANAADVVYAAIAETCRSRNDTNIDRIAWALAAAQYNKYSMYDAAEEKRQEKNRTDLSPTDILATIDRHVHGQDDAKRAAAMVMWHHFRGERSNVVFCGPTGCGKSEIWRALAGEYPDAVRIVDFSRMTGDGWSGSLHLRDVFEGLDPTTIARNGLVVVLDEADKIFCETAIGSGGTDHNKVVQSTVLKMLDGDTIGFGSDNNRLPAFSINCEKVSVVVLGAFESMLERKNRTTSGLGFGKEIHRDRDYGDMEITHEDLITAGMRREIAGRMGKIVSLSPLSREDYARILNKFVIPALSGGVREVVVDESFAADLLDRAVESKLGVRWMRSRLAQRLDDLIFENPNQNTYVVSD